MKRFLVTIVALMFSAICLTSCSCEKQSKAYVKIGDEWKVVAVKNACEHTYGVIHLTLDDGTELFVNMSNCIVYDGTLPIKK